MVGGGWRLAVGGDWRLAVGGGWWLLVVDGSWRLAVGGPLGRSLRAVLSKKKKSGLLRTALGGEGVVGGGYCQAAIGSPPEACPPPGALGGSCRRLVPDGPKGHEQQRTKGHAPRRHLVSRWCRRRTHAWTLGGGGGGVGQVVCAIAGLRNATQSCHLPQRPIRLVAGGEGEGVGRSPPLLLWSLKGPRRRRTEYLEAKILLAPKAPKQNLAQTLAGEEGGGGVRAGGSRGEGVPLWLSAVLMHPRLAGSTPGTWGSGRAPGVSGYDD